VAAVTNRRRYVAIYERDRESDAWLVHVEGIDGCHTYGRTLRQAGERIEEALAVWLDREPGEVALAHQWPEHISELASGVEKARRASADASRAASVATVSAARRLATMGLSRRDTAEILGISHQRVQQLLNA
jgi:predicted RNase H-like HicB family nuclease